VHEARKDRGDRARRSHDDRARSGGNRLLWANGRDTALEFYIRIGFHVVGESFSDLVSQLPHHVVLLEL